MAEPHWPIRERLHHWGSTSRSHFLTPPHLFDITVGWREMEVLWTHSPTCRAGFSHKRASVTFKPSTNTFKPKIFYQYEVLTQVLELHLVTSEVSVWSVNHQVKQKVSFQRFNIQFSHFTSCVVFIKALNVIVRSVSVLIMEQFRPLRPIHKPFPFCVYSPLALEGKTLRWSRKSKRCGWKWRYELQGCADKWDQMCVLSQAVVLLVRVEGKLLIMWVT